MTTDSASGTVTHPERGGGRLAPIHGVLFPRLCAGEASPHRFGPPPRALRRRVSPLTRRSRQVNSRAYLQARRAMALGPPMRDWGFLRVSTAAIKKPELRNGPPRSKTWGGEVDRVQPRSAAESGRPATSRPPPRGRRGSALPTVEWKMQQLQIVFYIFKCKNRFAIVSS